MKNLNLGLILVALLLISCTSYAQNFGIKAGYSLSNQLDKNNTINYSKAQNYKMLSGGKLGFVYNLRIYQNFSVESGLSLCTKGFKRKQEIVGDLLNQSSFLAYLDLPIHLKYSFDLKGQKVFAMAGSYFSYGVMGKRISKITIGSDLNSEVYDYHWGNNKSTDQFIHYDIGLDLGGGIQFGALALELIYSLGLKNISPYTENGTTIKNHGLGISLTYFFGKNNKPIFSDFTGMD